MPTRNQLQSMDPYDFEKLVAMVWEAEGYNTTVRQKSGDKGIDIEARQGEREEVIQVKRYHDSNKIGSQKVREYATLYQQTKADSVVIVTSGYFTDPALELARDLDVTTVNGNDLIERIDEGTLENINGTAVTATGEDHPDSGLVQAIWMFFALGLPGAVLILLFGWILGARLESPVGSWVLFAFIGGYYGLKLEHFSPSYWRSDHDGDDGNHRTGVPNEIITKEYRYVKYFSLIHIIGFIPIMLYLGVGYLLWLTIISPLVGYYISTDKKYLISKFDQDKLLDFWLKSNNLSEEQNYIVRPLFSNQITRRITRSWLFSTVLVPPTLGFYPLFYFLFTRLEINRRLSSNPSAFDTEETDSQVTTAGGTDPNRSLTERWNRNPSQISLDELREHLHADDPTMRAETAKVILQLAGDNPRRIKPIVNDLQAYINDSNGKIRKNVINTLALVALESPEDVRPLIQDLRDRFHDDQGEVRSGAILAVAGIADEYPEDVRPFVKSIRMYLGDEHKLVRQNAAMLMQYMLSEYPELSEAFIEDLLPRLTDANAAVRVNTARAVMEISAKRPEVLRHFLTDIADCLDDNDYRVRNKLVLILGMVAYEYDKIRSDTVQELRPLLEDENEETREFATAVIRDIRSLE